MPRKGKVRGGAAVDGECVVRGGGLMHVGKKLQAAGKGRSVAAIPPQGGVDLKMCEKRMPGLARGCSALTKSLRGKRSVSSA